MRRPLHSLHCFGGSGLNHARLRPPYGNSCRLCQLGGAIRSRRSAAHRLSHRFGIPSTSATQTGISSRPKAKTPTDIPEFLRLMLSQNEQRYDYRTFECSPFRRRKDLLRENTGGIDRCDSRCQRDFPHEALGDFPVPPDSRSMASAIIFRASSGPAHFKSFTHFPFSRSL
jgi:hypothetical protein